MSEVAKVPVQQSEMIVSAGQLYPYSVICCDMYVCKNTTVVLVKDTEHELFLSSMKGGK